MDLLSVRSPSYSVDRCVFLKFSRTKLDLLQLLMSSYGAGLKQTVEHDYPGTTVKIGEMISLDDENGTKISSFSVVPSEFVEDMESSWKGHVKRMHIEEEFEEVERAAEALSLAVSLQKS
ncbi:hypothetical protein FNV43_RR27156 [Rhamnella rubrinervis]|uniref:Uncharacterized protein n=1 Tax=Rhamnella rubrinervis TaxID=2594499 RepID=A0A8K0GPF3_9ROSA|nr:hypothetical protein FNV43_RR27156 [Rhamnella rubrinervis]